MHSPKDRTPFQPFKPKDLLNRESQALQLLNDESLDVSPVFQELAHRRSHIGIEANPEHQLE